jgi:orotate phosphoribosyltransferase
MVPLLPADADVLCGLELGGVPIATVLSQITGIPAAFIRKTAKTYGTCRYAEGADLSGRSPVLIEDVVSSGGAILDAVTKLAQDGIPIKVAVCVIDRESGGAEALAARGIELRRLFTMREIEAALADSASVS